MRKLTYGSVFTDRLGVFNEDDMKKVGINGKNFRGFIDLMMAVPLDELLADLDRE